MAIGLAAPALAQAQVAPTTRQLELAREILRTTGAEANYDTSLRNMFKPMFQQTAAMAGSPAATAKAQATTDAMTEAVIRMKPQMIDITARVYAQTFSEEELSQLLAFYKTPLGQTLTQKMPTLTKNIGQAIASEMPNLMRGLARELCATGECAPALRALAEPTP